MRTTLTLDDDVAALLRQAARKQKGSFKLIVNEALRRGLSEMSPRTKPAKSYRTPSVSLGRCLLGSLDDVAEVLAVGEGDAFR